MKKILVPTDFSHLANCSLHFAVQIAERSKASILLLHIVEHNSQYNMSSTGEVLKDSMADVFILKLVEKSKSQLEEIIDSQHTEVNIDYVIQVGNPSELILEAIIEHTIDLVVMGSTGVNWLDRILVGSTTEKVVSNASCPVITLKCNVENLNQLQHIVLAANLEEDQTMVMKELKKLQQILGSQLHLLTVNTPHSFNSSKILNERLKAFVATHQVEKYTTHIYNDTRMEDGLVHFTEEINADMIALPIHSQLSILNVLTPHSTDELINHAKRPVWTFNPNNVTTAVIEEREYYKCIS